MGIQICSNKEAGPNKGQNKENFDKSSKVFFSWSTGQNALMFVMDRPWGKAIRFCSNEVLGSCMAPS